MAHYMAGAEPFSFPGNRTGCLLIHGITGTPREMRGLGEWLHARFGYTVTAPALAGHATRVEDMVNTGWRDWFASVIAGYETLSRQCGQVMVAGLSLGGALALFLASERPVQAVVAASAPLEIHLAPEPLFRRMPFLFRLVPFVKKNPAQSDTQDRSAQAQHLEYDCYPTRPVASLVWDFLPHLRDALPKVRAPALLFQARDDRMIPSDSMPRIHALLGSQVKEMVWLERGGHLAFEDYGREQAFQALDAFLRVNLTV